MFSRQRIAEWTVLAAEAVALYMLATVLAQGAAGRGPSYPAMAAALFGGFALVRGLGRFEIGSTAVTAVAIAGTLLGLGVLLTLQYDPQHLPISLGWIADLAADPDRTLLGRWGVVWGSVLLIAAWFRGVMAAQRSLTHQGALLSFTIGLIIVVLALLFGQATSAAAAVDRAAMPFFTLGLLSLALVHLGRADDGSTTAARAPWLLTLLATVGGLVLVAALVGIFPIDLLNTVLAPVGTLALKLLDLLIFIIAVPLYFIISFLVRLVTGGRQLEFPTPQNLASEGFDRLQRAPEQGGPPELLALLLKTIVLGTVLALTGYLVWRVFRRLNKPLNRRQEGELHEAIQGDGLGADMNALMDALLGRFRRGDASPVRVQSELARVRAAYVKALARAEKHGAVRAPALTASEFAPALATALETPAAATLSDRYVAARYGGIWPDGGEVATLEREIESR